MEKKLEEADTLIQEMVSQDENNEEDNWLDIAFLYTD